MDKAKELYIKIMETVDKFDAKFVKKMLDENNLKVDFTASELLNVWRKG